MQTRHQGIEVMRRVFESLRVRAGFVPAFVAASLLASPCAALAQNRTQQTPPSTTRQPAPPAGTTTQQPQPGAAPTPTTRLPPNSSSAPIRPGNEAQQSTQPQTGPEQERQQTTPNTQGPRPPSPQTPGQQPPAGTTPQTSTPAGTTPPQAGTNPGGAQTTNPAGVPQGPGENVGTSGVAPAELPTEPPPVAPNFEAPLRPLPSAERVGVDMSEQAPLSLNDAIALALQNNNDIDASRIDVQVAEYNLTAARGVYDPVFSSESYYESRTTPTSSTIAGGLNGSVTQKDVTGAVRFGGFSPWAGGSYQLDFSSTRLQTNNQNVVLNPQYPAALTLTYAQPLLRGLRFDQNRRLIEIGKKNLSLTDAQFRQRAVETITNVQRAYWDLVYALRNLQIQREAVGDARKQLEHNRRLVSEGMLAPIDVVAAEAQISGFEQSVYSALDDVGRAENNLKNLVAENREAPIWRVAIVPSESVELAAPQVALDDAMQYALKSRPELLSSDVAREINEIERRFAREQTRPQVDLVASYGMVGLAGTLQSTTNPLTASSDVIRQRINALVGAVNPTLPLTDRIPLIPDPVAQPFPGRLVGGEFQSLGNLAANRYTNFRVGVTVNLPFRNTTAKAQYGRTLVDEERIRTQREQLEQLIQVDVRNALQQVRTAESRLRAAASARSASEQQYASEQRKLDAGQSTVFLVLERQTQLATARGNELRAQTELNKAIAELQRATGNALEQNRVEIRVR